MLHYERSKVKYKFAFSIYGIFSLYLFFFFFSLFFCVSPHLNSMGLTKDKLAKSIIRFPRARTRRANSFPSPLLNHAESPEARDSSRKIREGTRTPLCTSRSLSLSLVTQPPANRILIGPMLTMFVDILYLTHHLAHKLFYKQIIATAGSPPP